MDLAAEREREREREGKRYANYGIMSYRNLNWVL